MRWSSPFRLLALLLSLFMGLLASARSTELRDQAKAKQVWQLLDYMLTPAEN